jgi:uncharacterized protein
MDETAPKSPCNQICVLGADELCLGCYRTRDEIAAWSQLSYAEQRTVLGRLERRRTKGAESQRNFLTLE